jgi:hypothetical protein
MLYKLQKLTSCILQPFLILTAFLTLIKKGFAIRREIFTFALSKTVDVAQLVRASVCGTEGRGFEPHHLPRVVLDLRSF